MELSLAECEIELFRLRSISELTLALDLIFPRPRYPAKQMGNNGYLGKHSEKMVKNWLQYIGWQRMLDLGNMGGKYTKLSTNYKYYNINIS